MQEAMEMVQWAQMIGRFQIGIAIVGVLLLVILVAMVFGIDHPTVGQRIASRLIALAIVVLAATEIWLPDEQERYTKVLFAINNAMPKYELEKKHLESLQLVAESKFPQRGCQ